jgi:cellulose 1,4-beta-cellobiosidase
MAALVLAAGVALGAAEAAPGEGVAQARLDNPYDGAQAYVDPEWSARAAAEPGGAAVADQPTAVWLDRIAAVDGADGGMGLRDHLDEALAQGADLVQLVLDDLPLRDCDRLIPQGELGVDELPRYRTEFVDPIAEILADPAYAGLRIVAVIEPGAVPSLITHTSPRPSATITCDMALDSGVYVEGIGYALARLGEIPTVYSYLDIGHHGRLGWPGNRVPAAELYLRAATLAGGTAADVHGFVANTAGYAVLREEFFSVDETIAGEPVTHSAWVDWNDFADEIPYAQRFREELVDVGFDENVGVVIDTSRNGWGGPDRPTGPGPRTGVDAYVDGGRLDRRPGVYNWCNQAGAGLGERPTASPEPGIDAFAWLKPPGESDGVSRVGERQIDPMCDAQRVDPIPTGALPDAPPAGEWFSTQFQQLLASAHPPL